MLLVAVVAIGAVLQLSLENSLLLERIAALQAMHRHTVEVLTDMLEHSRAEQRKLAERLESLARPVRFERTTY